MAYPSNKRTFRRIAYEADVPALIVRNVATDHMMVPKQFERAPDINISPIDNWGKYYSSREVEFTVLNVMRNIIIDFWMNLDEYYKVHAIYSVYYHDPQKRNMKIAIEQFDKKAHDRALETADKRFSERLQPDKFHDFMLKETWKEKKDGYLKGYLSRIIRKNEAPPGQYFLPKQLPDLRDFHRFWFHGAKEKPIHTDL